MAKPKITTEIIAGLSATMSVTGAGFGFGWPSPSLPKLLAVDPEMQISWIVSVFTIGGAIGVFLGATAVDRFGRKWLLLSTIIPHLVGCVLIGVAQDFWWLITARMISGIGGGMAYAVLPMYTGEIASDRIRGAVSGMVDPMLNVAVVITYCIGPWVSIQALVLLGGAMPLIFGLIFVWMPESPYFLMMKEKPDQAEKSLSWLRGTKDVTEELKMIQNNVESELKNSGTIQDLVMIPGNRKALIIIVGLMVAQQLSGIAAVVAYSSLIFEASGSELNSSVTVIIFGVIQMLAGVLAAFLVDFAGRRILMLISTIGSILCLVGLATYYQLQSNGTDVSSVSWLPAIFMIGFILICTIGLGALPYVVLAETFPCYVKALGTMIANIVPFLSSVAVTQLFQVVADSYGVHVSFWGFAGVSVFSVIFIYFMLPETKQRSLQEIQDELHKTTESKTTLNKS